MINRLSLYINNQWKEGNADPFASINPATNDVVWKGNAASNKDIDEAIRTATEAFPDWSNTPLATREQFLNRFKQCLNESKDPLSLAISQETGKPLWESKSEVSTMINKIDISIEANRQRCHKVSKEHPSATSITRYRPHGVVAVFGPFNFPGHLPNGHIVPALLAGNTVVFKPSEYAPLVAEVTAKCWEAANLPKGVFNLVQGGKNTGQYLAQHPSINGLFFTGSWQTGRALSEQFGSRPEKILAVEMGGNNPLVVSELSDIKAAAYLTVQSAYLTSGQRCTCARRLIVIHHSNSEDYLAELIRMIHTIKVGAYTDSPEPFMGPVISRQAANTLIQAQNILIQRGGQPLVKMELLQEESSFLSPGLIDVTPITDRPDDEYFGPLLQLIKVNSFEEAIEEANRTSYGLAAGLLSDNEMQYKEFYRRIRAGVVNWNVQLTGASSSAPFGGIGHSGNHRPSAYYAADYCSYPVASLESSKIKMPSVISPGIKE